ncbi:50S ribosomal protein L16 [Candidatus Woesearchaeota archaeon CG10_big_fil_rev_8_21_14_0_10_37_12]|nr:MAG: 50S ribosomal protein L16 [Candidatus Woesearchaeota archaeon CG10_big_fil_rev_8_21_14_0_10_37_12]
MARLRKFCAYRSIKRPYTRYSKYKAKSFVRARPANRIARYVSGKEQDYPFLIHLVAKNKVQIRDNAIESARLTANRTIEKVLGKIGFYLKVRIYPHHIMRENPLAAGAGADRLSTGMAHSFGKPIGVAAQVRVGQELYTIGTTKEHVALARTALKKAAKKLPLVCGIKVDDLTITSKSKNLLATTITTEPTKKEDNLPAEQANA